MTKFFFKGGKIINSTDVTSSNVLINNGLIEKVTNETISDKNIEIIDVTGKYIIPGGIDPHVHFYLKTNAGYSADDFLTGSKAAIAGGTTTIIDFITPEKNQSLSDAFLQRCKDAEKCQCNYSFHMSPISWNKSMAQEMTKTVNELGISSFKVYMAYTDTIGLNYNELESVFKQAAALNALVLVHAEDDIEIKRLKQLHLSKGETAPKFHSKSRPAEVEYKAVKTAIELSEKTGVKLYFVHISSKQSVDLIKEAQEKGLPIIAETCPQYLLFDERDLDQPFEKSAPYVFSPALHEEFHKDFLWKGVENKIITTIGTDHCPFNLKDQKELGRDDFTKIPNGTGGVEHRLELLYSYGVLKQKLSLEQWVAITSSNVAQLFGLKNKGQIKQGYDADFVIFDPEIESQISINKQFQNCDNNIYAGKKLKGKVEQVFVNGQLVYNKGIHKSNQGKLIKR